MEAKNLEKKAIGIVAQLFDLAEVPLDKRQEINDIAYDYVAKQLTLTDVIKCPNFKIETIIETSKAIDKYELALTSASKNRELLIAFLAFYVMKCEGGKKIDMLNIIDEFSEIHNV